MNSYWASNASAYQRISAQSYKEPFLTYYLPTTNYPPSATCMQGEYEQSSRIFWMKNLLTHFTCWFYLLYSLQQIKEDLRALH